MSSPSVCIVGAGASGLASAVHLARRGVADVTVIEADYPAGGSSGLSVGVIETQHTTPLALEISARAMQLFDELERDHGLRIVRTGYLRLARSASEAETFAPSVRAQHDLGIPDARILRPDEITKLVPDLNTDGIECGLWGPRDGFIDGHLYCSLLAELARSLGVRILVRQPLKESVHSASGGHRIRTPGQEIDADLVVNAAGAWAPAVAEILGTEMPISPQRHEAVIVHLREPLRYVMPMVMDYAQHSNEAGVYFRHERSQQLVAGLHSDDEAEEVSDLERYARSASPEFLEGVAERLSERLPSLADASLAHGWAGLYPVSPDGLPQVGPTAANPTVIAAGGAGGYGIQFSPVIGELVADWIIDGQPKASSYGSALDPRRAALGM